MKKLLRFIKDGEVQEQCFLVPDGCGGWKNPLRPRSKVKYTREVGTTSNNQYGTVAHVRERIIKTAN